LLFRRVLEEFDPIVQIDLVSCFSYYRGRILLLSIGSLSLIEIDEANVEWRRWVIGVEL
jgi:hypothetical protein